MRYCLESFLIYVLLEFFLPFYPLSCFIIFSFGCPSVTILVQKVLLEPLFC